MLRDGKSDFSARRFSEKIAYLEENIKYSNAEEERLVAKLEELQKRQDLEEEEVKRKISCMCAKKKAVENALKKLQRPVHHELPEEPRALHFVEGTWFHALGHLVVIANVAILVLHKVSAAYRNDYQSTDTILNNIFTVFYVLELGLKWMLWKGKLLCGGIHVLWNWMDLFIVATSIVDLWILPVLRDVGVLHSSRGGIAWVGFLRSCRLLRIVKLLGRAFRGDLSWVKSDRFQVLMMLVIAVNCVIIGLECDFDGFWAWVWVEQALLIIFSFELTVRLKFEGCRFFIDPEDYVWNWLDLVIVSGGIVDQWMIPAVHLLSMMMHPSDVDNSDGNGNVGQIMMLIRMARLLRVLRLVRLIHNIPPLYRLIVSIAQAMQGMLWVLLLALILLYIFGILAVRLISHGLIFGGKAPDCVREIFASVPESIFVLFQVMNGSTSAIEPLFNILPVSEPVFMFFTIISSWAILSILTAVINENMFKSADQHRDELREKDEQRKAKRSREILERMFTELYEKFYSSGSAMNGYEMRVTQAQYATFFDGGVSEAKLAQATGLPMNDLNELFGYVSRRHEGEQEATVSKIDFIEGLQDEIKPVSERSIMRLEKRLADLEKAVEKKVTL